MAGVSRYRLLLLSSFSIFNVVSSSGCYYAYNTTVLSSPDYVDPCGNITSTSSLFLNCCAVQSNNICLSNSICYDPNPIGGAYYLSPCTDKTYSAPECPQYCSHRVDMNQLNVIYDSQSQIWRCCGTNEDGSADCTNPTDETFPAPPPSNLSTIYPITRASSSSSSYWSSSLSPSLHKAGTSTSSSALGTFNNSPSSSLYSSLLSSSSKAEAAASSTAKGVSNASNPTAPSSPMNNSNAGFSSSDKLALGVGLPATLATIAGAYFAFVTMKKRNSRHSTR